MDGRLEQDEYAVGWAAIQWLPPLDGRGGKKQSRRGSRGQKHQAVTPYLGLTHQRMAARNLKRPQSRTQPRTLNLPRARSSAVPRWLGGKRATPYYGPRVTSRGDFSLQFLPPWLDGPGAPGWMGQTCPDDLTLGWGGVRVRTQYEHRRGDNLTLGWGGVRVTLPKTISRKVRATGCWMKDIH